MRGDANIHARYVKMRIGSLLLQKLRQMRRDVRLLAVPLRRIPPVRQLFDIVHDAKQLPLCVDLRAAAQREAVEPLLYCTVPNTGSTAANRCAYCARPDGVSSRAFIRAV